MRMALVALAASMVADCPLWYGFDEYQAVPDGTCALVLDSPGEGVTVTPDQDAFVDTPGVQLALKGRVSGGSTCRTSLQFGLCGAQLTPAPQANDSFTLAFTLPSLGDFGICVQTTQSDGVARQVSRKISFSCPPSQMSCNGECVSDFLTNAHHCGSACTDCPGAVDGTATCKMGSCSIECRQDYHHESGRCVPRKGCDKLETACGDSDDCCAFDPVPSNGSSLSYKRSYDLSADPGIKTDGWQPQSSAPVQVRAFSLDRYEVTVGRFRSFVEQYDSRFVENASLRPSAHPSSTRSGWRESWESWCPAAMQSCDDDTLAGPVYAKPVPRTREALERRLGSCGTFSTWTSQVADRENEPITCVNFFEAFLFCMFDGGRLPTEAEWNAAAAGGEEQRPYPWSQTGSAVDISPENARYGQPNGGPARAGTYTSGRGRYGTFDLAGNVWEWVRDTAARDTAPPYEWSYPSQTEDPIDLTNDEDPEQTHGMRGGSFKFTPLELRSYYREARDSRVRFDDLGLRCARPAVVGAP
jgi:formylglycine-generating enzyme